MSEKHHERYIEELEDGTHQENSHIFGKWTTPVKIRHPDGSEEVQLITNYRDTYKTRPILEHDFISQAPPMRITPSRAKPEKRDHRVIVSIPDEQIGYRNIKGELHPIHDERAMRCARYLLKDIKPDVIVAQGDTLDMAELSRFAPDSDHFVKTLQPSIDRAAQWDAELAADHPNAEKIRLEGNHQRLTKFIMKHTAQLYGIKRSGEELPVLSIPYLVRADETGWRYITGYPANEYRYADDLVFVHGDKVKSNGSTAEAMSKKYPERNVVFGHVHRQEMHTRTNHLGRYIVAATFGTLARIDGAVPSFGNGIDHKNQVVERFENWQNGVGVIRDYDGEYTFEPIPIHDGVAYYRDKEYHVKHDEVE